MSPTNLPIDPMDHRAEADRGMRFRLADGGDITPTEHLLAAIHDEQQLQTGTLADLRGAIDDLAEVLRPKPFKIAWGQTASITAKAIEHEKAWLRLQAVTTDVDLIDALGRYVAAGVTAHDVERLIYSAACDPAPEPESDTLVEALDALPEGSVVRDGDGDPYRKHNGAWVCGCGCSSIADPWSSQRVADYAPIGIESIPGEDDPEPESVTVTLPRDVVSLALGRLDKAACWAGDDGQAAAARGHMEAWRALADALDAASATQEAAEGEGTDGERLVMACDWSDFRKDYGTSPDPEVSTREHRAFQAGWKAGRHGDQSGVLR